MSRKYTRKVRRERVRLPQRREWTCRERRFAYCAPQTSQIVVQNSGVKGGRSTLRTKK
jgi:hypothetical protein